MRVLLTEGSGLTSRQVATRLGELGHEVEVLSSTPLCLARFTRYVQRVHRAPPFGAAPLAWLEAVEEIAARARVDLLFPTQEQVTVLSARAARLGVPSVVPPFSALARVQDKLGADACLRAAGVPVPDALVARERSDLRAVRRFPVFVKRPVGTASTGVRRASDDGELARAFDELGGGPLLVQAAVDGPLAMVQALAQDGRLVAVHACVRAREGVGGGAVLKESFHDERVVTLARALVASLAWHGPLSLDLIRSAEGPLVIDVNPRLVEPRNAFLAGVDLVGMMLGLARGETFEGVAIGRAGVRSHQLLLAELDAAKEGRLAVARELLRAVSGRGDYRGSREELTPTAHDARAILPVLTVAAAALVAPQSARWLARSSVAAYAVTSEGWSAIVRDATHASATTA